ncbi:MAG TPA: beta-N-acetylhexosaminidase [Polyangiaceae bacterium]|jgi:hexosaminidase|nr:beta-N-acetylhexosaminidase [Polyangiaceae bacterium]
MLKLTQGPAHRELSRTFPKLFSLTRGVVVAGRPRAQPGFSINRDGTRLVIEHQSRSDWFRALGELARDSELARLEVTAEFEFRGLMIDASRNGVPHVESLEQRIVELALLGINQLTLYTEDTYEVQGQPLIGYMRGAYSKSELRRVVAFAKSFGIEMFPCIQTLAHLEQVLQYRKAYAKLRDTASVLSVKSKHTRDFVAALLDSAAAPYESRRIHLGMDEPWDLGRGTCFEVNRKIDPRELYLTHLKMVAGLCQERKLEPTMWGDLVLGQHAFNGDLPMTAAQWRKIPKNITLNYWQYFSEDETRYRTDMRRFREHGFEPIVSPGLWNWDRFWGLHEKAKRTFLPMLRVAKAEGVRRVLMTMWGDDGQEAPYRSNFPGLALYAEHCFRKTPSDDDVARMVQTLTGDSLRSFLLPSQLDCPDEAAILGTGNLAKSFIWDDPLLGLFSSHFERRPMTPHYAKLSAQLSVQARSAAPRNRALFRFASALSACLALKADLRTRARRAYLARDRRRLLEITADVGKTLVKVQGLWRAHRAIWLQENKPFGLEVLDLRYGGQLSRLQILRERLGEHLAGRAPKIEEFEVKPQNFLGKYPHHGRKYRGTASPVFSIWV